MSKKISTGLKLAIKACGSKSELARRLGVQRQAVQKWPSIPLKRIVKAEEVTGIPREKLAPEIYR